MAKVVFYLPGNTTHSFLIEDRWQKMYEEGYGLEALGQTNVPIAVSHQRIDYELCPFLSELHNQYKNVEVVGAPYGHGLLPLVRFGSEKEVNNQLRWEINNGVGTNLPVTFFSEFYTPEEWIIPTEFFFFLKEQTCSYSLQVSEISFKDEDVSAPLPANTIGVRYGSKIGIVLDGFQGFLKAWFAFSAVPDEPNLAKLMREFEGLIADPREFIVVPLDLEQPYVGSTLGQELWKRFFGAVAAHPAGDKVVPLSSVLVRCRETAVSIRQPHRVLSKWTTHRVQLDAILKLNGLKPTSEKERLLFSLAFASDHLSSLNRQALASIGAAKSIKCCDPSGKETLMSQAHNRVLQDCCNSAYLALRHKEGFVEKLERLEMENFLVHQLIAWANKYGL